MYIELSRHLKIIRSLLMCIAAPNVDNVLVLRLLLVFEPVAVIKN